jgi:hypothetical protein
MDWAAILGTAIGGVGSAATGGILGIFGSSLGAVAKYFQARQEHKQKKEMLELQMQAVSQQGSWDGLQMSHESAKSSSDTYKWVNAIRGLYRPLLTTALLVVAYILFCDLLDIVRGSNTNDALMKFLTAGEVKELLKYIVYSLVFSTSTAIVWWFGDRAFTPPGLKNR